MSDFEIIDVTEYESDGCMDCDTTMTRRKIIIRHNPSGAILIYDTCLGCGHTNYERKEKK